MSQKMSIASLLVVVVTTACTEPPADLETRLAAGGLDALGYLRQTGAPANFIGVSFGLEEEVDEEGETENAGCLTMSFPNVSVTVDGADAPWGSVETDEGGANEGGGLTLVPGDGSGCSSPTIEVDVTELTQADASERHVVVFSDNGSTVLTVEASADEGAISCNGVLPCEVR